VKTPPFSPQGVGVGGDCERRIRILVFFQGSQTVDEVGSRNFGVDASGNGGKCAGERTDQFNRVLVQRGKRAVLADAGEAVFSR